MKKVLIAALIAGFSLSATAAETIRFATEASYPPFESIDANNQIVGFDVDLAQALCKEIDATCTFSNQAFDSLIPSLKFRRVEAVMAGMDITPEREKQVLFTRASTSSAHLLPVLSLQKDSLKLQRPKVLTQFATAVQARVTIRFVLNLLSRLTLLT